MVTPHTWLEGVMLIHIGMYFTVVFMRHCLNVSGDKLYTVINKVAPPLKRDRVSVPDSFNKSMVMRQQTIIF